MPFCERCGAALGEDSQFCPKCGAQVNASSNLGGSQFSSSPSSLDQPPNYSSTPPPPPTFTVQPVVLPATRPTGVAILAVLTSLGGLAEIGFAVFGHGFEVGILVVLGLISLATAYGLWTGAWWAYWLAFVAAILNIVSVIFLDVLAFLIGLFMIYYLRRPHVKAWFNRP